jgi:hypothetical protein
MQRGSRRFAPDRDATLQSSQPSRSSTAQSETNTAPVPKAPACSDISDGDRSTQARSSLFDRRADVANLGDEIVIYSSNNRYAITSLRNGRSSTHCHTAGRDKSR